LKVTLGYFAIYSVILHKVKKSVIWPPFSTAVAFESPSFGNGETSNQIKLHHIYYTTKGLKAAHKLLKHAIAIQTTSVNVYTQMYTIRKVKKKEKQEINKKDVKRTKNNSK